MITNSAVVFANGHAYVRAPATIVGGIIELIGPILSEKYPPITRPKQDAKFAMAIK